MARGEKLATVHTTVHSGQFEHQKRENHKPARLTLFFFGVAFSIARVRKTP